MQVLWPRNWAMNKKTLEFKFCSLLGVHEFSLGKPHFCTYYMGMIVLACFESSCKDNGEPINMKHSLFNKPLLILWQCLRLLYSRAFKVTGAIFRPWRSMLNLQFGRNLVCFPGGYSSWPGEGPGPMKKKEKKSDEVLWGRSEVQETRNTIWLMF